MQSRNTHRGSALVVVMVFVAVFASQFKFTGNASGVIKGSVLNLDDTEFQMTGNSSLTIDHDGLNEDPAGMEFPRTMQFVAGSYDE
jgi:hypothetical protein